MGHMGFAVGVKDGIVKNVIEPGGVAGAREES